MAVVVTPLSGKDPEAISPELQQRVEELFRFASDISLVMPV
jgi:hypothetical protein